MERTTAQRRAIRGAFEKAARPLGPSEVHELAQAGTPSLGIATVYRTLKAMVGEGDLIEVALPGEPPRYELSGLHHHHHFRCNACGKVYDIEGCPGNLKAMVPRGFRLQRHELILFGRCAACA